MKEESKIFAKADIGLLQAAVKGTPLLLIANSLREAIEKHKDTLELDLLSYGLKMENKSKDFQNAKAEIYAGAMLVSIWFTVNEGNVDLDKAYDEYEFAKSIINLTKQ